MPRSSPSASPSAPSTSSSTERASAQRSTPEGPTPRRSAVEGSAGRALVAGEQCDAPGAPWRVAPRRRADVSRDRRDGRRRRTGDLQSLGGPPSALVVRTTLALVGAGALRGSERI